LSESSTYGRAWKLVDAALDLAADGWSRQDAELYRVAAYTGMRLSELLALRWEDVDLERRRVIIHRAVSAGVEGPTKSRERYALTLRTLNRRTADPATQAFA
jgi:integrase